MKGLLLILLLTSQVGMTQTNVKTPDDFKEYQVKASFVFMHYDHQSDAYERFSLNWQSETGPKVGLKNGASVESFKKAIDSLFNSQEAKVLYDFEKAQNEHPFVKIQYFKKGKKVQFSIPEKFSPNPILTAVLEKWQTFLQGSPAFDFSAFEPHQKDTITCEAMLLPQAKLNENAYFNYCKSQPLEVLNEKYFNYFIFDGSGYYFTSPSALSLNDADSTYLITTNEPVTIYIIVPAKAMVVKQTASPSDTISINISSNIVFRIVAVTTANKQVAVIQTPTTTQLNVLSDFSLMTVDEFLKLLFD